MYAAETAVEASAAKAIHFRLSLCRGHSRGGGMRPGSAEGAHDADQAEGRGAAVAAAGVEEAVGGVGGGGDCHVARYRCAGGTGGQAKREQTATTELGKPGQDGVAFSGAGEAEGIHRD